MITSDSVASMFEFAEVSGWGGMGALRLFQTCPDAANTVFAGKIGEIWR